MSSIVDALIFDRNQEDANHAESLGKKINAGTATSAEVLEYINTTFRGCYNYTDLNRVTEAMRYLSSRFRQYGYQSSVQSRADWTMADVPTVSDMDTYLGDLRRLRAVFAVLSTTPDVPPDMELLTWQEANDIEQILVDINTVIERVLKSFRRSGAFMFYSGHEPFPSAESDLGRTVEDFDRLGVTVADLDAHGTSFYILSYGVLK